jgi:tetratricopeptide (TPR) repeat protein
VRGFDATMIAYSDLPLIRERAREERARLLKMGSDPDAEERRLRELSEGDDLLAAQSALGLARLSVRRGAAAEATSRYQDVRVRHGNQVQIRVEASTELAELLASTGDVAGAEALLREEVQIVGDPELGLALRQAQVETRYQAGDMDGALTAARRTVKWAQADMSMSLRARLQLAGLADEAGKFDEAIDLYKAVALAAQDPGLAAAARFGQATLMRRRGVPEAAIPLMDSALMQLPAQHAFRGAIVVERAEVLAELGRSSPAAVEQMLADARAAGLDENQPVAYASLLLMLGRDLAAAGRQEDALNVYQQVAASSAGGEEPALRQQAVQGQVEALVALGRQEQAAALLDNTSLDGLTSGGADETCDALRGLALARVDAGEIEAAIEGFDKVFETCRSPRFLVAHLPPISDLLVGADRTEAAQALLQSLIDAPAVPAEGKQAAALELGRLGSVAALDQAADGPDEALAALARIEIAGRLEEAGEVDQARAILRAIAEDTGAETFPRGLAQLRLGRLAAEAGDRGGARVWLVQARDAGDSWLRDQASQALTGLDGPDGS